MWRVDELTNSQRVSNVTSEWTARCLRVGPIQCALNPRTLNVYDPRFFFSLFGSMRFRKFLSVFWRTPESKRTNPNSSFFRTLHVRDCMCDWAFKEAPLARGSCASWCVACHPVVYIVGPYHAVNTNYQCDYAQTTISTVNFGPLTKSQCVSSSHSQAMSMFSAQLLPLQLWNLITYRPSPIYFALCKYHLF